MTIKEFKKNILNKSIIIEWNKHNFYTLKSFILYLKTTSKISVAENKNLIKLFQNDFSKYNINQRLLEIQKLGKDASSLRALILRYGEKEANIRYNEKSKKLAYKSSKEYFIEKYGEEIGLEKLKLKCPNNIKTLKKKYPNNWQEKLNEYLTAYKKSVSLEYYIELFGEKEGTQKYNDVQKSKGSTLEKYVKKHGEIEGPKKYEERKKKQSYRMSKQYYLDTYGEELGLEIFKQYTITECTKKKMGQINYQLYLEKRKEQLSKPILEQYIEIYGIDGGTKLYEEYIIKQKKAHTLEYFIEKYGDDGNEKYVQYKNKLIHNLQNKHNTSNVSKELFEQLDNQINNEALYYKKDVKKEFFIKYENKLYFYDFMYKNKIIEFNGDFWHMNPNKYKHNDINKLSKTSAQEIWDYDKLKHEIIKKQGFDIFIIWESEYRKNKTQTINNCIKFLKNE